MRAVPPPLGGAQDTALHEEGELEQKREWPRARMLQALGAANLKPPETWSFFCSCCSVFTLAPSRPPYQEDELLIKCYRRWGNSWTKIAHAIGGRTDNAVKNRFTSLADAVSQGGARPGLCTSGHTCHGCWLRRQLQLPQQLLSMPAL